MGGGQAYTAATTASRGIGKGLVCVLACGRLRGNGLSLCGAAGCWAPPLQQ